MTFRPILAAAILGLAAPAVAQSAYRSEAAAQQVAGSLKIPVEVARELTPLEVAVIHGIRNTRDLNETQQEREIRRVIEGTNPRLSLSLGSIFR